MLKAWYNLQDKLNQSSQENRQLSDEFEQLDSEHAQLHSDFHSLEQENQSALSNLRNVTAELSQFKQQATAEYDSFRAQSQEEVEYLQNRVDKVQRQHQLSSAQVQTLQDQLEKSHTYIAALQNQLGIGQSEGRMPPGQGMKSPRPVRTSSLTGSMRSPKSPGGSSTSSGTSSRARMDFQVRISHHPLSAQSLLLLCIFMPASPAHTALCLHPPQPRMHYFLSFFKLLAFSGSIHLTRVLSAFIRCLQMSFAVLLHCSGTFQKSFSALLVCIRRCCMIGSNLGCLSHPLTQATSQRHLWLCEGTASRSMAFVIDCVCRHSSQTHSSLSVS